MANGKQQWGEEGALLVVGAVGSVERRYSAVSDMAAVVLTAFLLECPSL